MFASSIPRSRRRCLGDDHALEQRRGRVQANPRGCAISRQAGASVHTDAPSISRQVCHRCKGNGPVSACRLPAITIRAQKGLALSSCGAVSELETADAGFARSRTVDCGREPRCTSIVDLGAAWREGTTRPTDVRARACARSRSDSGKAAQAVHAAGAQRSCGESPAQHRSMPRFPRV